MDLPTNNHLRFGFPRRFLIAILLGIICKFNYYLFYVKIILGDYYE